MKNVENCNVRGCLDRERSLSDRLSAAQLTRMKNEYTRVTPKHIIYPSQKCESITQAGGGLCTAATREGIPVTQEGIDHLGQAVAPLPIPLDTGRRTIGNCADWIHPSPRLHPLDFSEGWKLVLVLHSCRPSYSKPVG